MREKVKIFNVVLILLCIHEYAFNDKCKGQMCKYCRINGSPCCSGYIWDQDQALCISCNIGYIGINCEERCPFPYFGMDCQSTCNCSEKICDYVNGCRHSTSEQPYSSSRYMGLNFRAISTTLYTIKYHKSGFNATEVKDSANNLQTGLKTAETSYQANNLMYAIIGLSVAVIIITAIYIYTCKLQKCKLTTTCSTV